MKNKSFGLVARLVALTAFVSVCSSSVLSQRTKPKPAASAKPGQIIFAVVNDGVSVEPIAFVEKGKLAPTGTDTSDANSTLSKLYYKTGAKYNLIFGGAPSGTVIVSKSNLGTECGGSSAEVSVQSSRAKLKGFVMALATNITPKTKGTGTRRIPTAAERTETEALVRSEYAKHKVPAATYKQLHYHNLTAVDVNGDGVAELVGSYWVAPKTAERGLLFFIAEKDASGKYSFNYSEYESYTADKVMSGQLKDLEDGIYQTLLLDVFDYDSDGTAEIFTVSEAFEGNNYAAFKRTDGKWAKVMDAYDYRCGY